MHFKTNVSQTSRIFTKLTFEKLMVQPVAISQNRLQKNNTVGNMFPVSPKARSLSHPFLVDFGPKGFCWTVGMQFVEASAWHMNK
jgi:hypothetical protein